MRLDLARDLVDKLLRRDACFLCLLLNLLAVLVGAGLEEYVVAAAVVLKRAIASASTIS